MFCAECGADQMFRSRNAFHMQYKDSDLIVEGVEHWECPECGAIEFEADDSLALTKALDAAYRETNGFLTPDEIKSLRKRLDLSQQDFETLLGVTSPTVSRWETGKVVQTRTADNLMRLMRNINCVPEELKKICGLTSSNETPIKFLETCIMFEDTESEKNYSVKEVAQYV